MRELPKIIEGKDSASSAFDMDKSTVRSEQRTRKQELNRSTNRTVPLTKDSLRKMSKRMGALASPASDAGPSSKPVAVGASVPKM